MSHMRSASARGLVGLLAAELVGISVHDVAVERRESYLADWSGVRGAGGGEMEALEELSKGVLMVEEELGRESMEVGDGLFTGWIADPLEVTAFPAVPASVGRAVEAMMGSSNCQVSRSAR